MCYSYCPEVTLVEDRGDLFVRAAFVEKRIDLSDDVGSSDMSMVTTSISSHASGPISVKNRPTAPCAQHGRELAEQRDRHGLLEQSKSHCGDMEPTASRG